MDMEGIEQEVEGRSGWRTTGHAVLVLPYEQFLLNAFEKTPWRDKTKSKRERERRKKTERSGSRNTVKAHRQVNKNL